MGIDIYSRDITMSKLVCSQLKMGLFKKKNNAPIGSKFFPLFFLSRTIFTIFRRKLVYRKGNSKSQKLSPLLKMAKNLPGVAIHL